MVSSGTPVETHEATFLGTVAGGIMIAGFSASSMKSVSMKKRSPLGRASLSRDLDAGIEGISPSTSSSLTRGSQ